MIANNLTNKIHKSWINFIGKEYIDTPIMNEYLQFKVNDNHFKWSEFIKPNNVVGIIIFSNKPKNRKIINIYNDVARKYGNITVKHFRKYEKLQYRNNKLKLDVDFLNNCKQLGVYPKFLIFKLPNVSNKDAVSIRKKLLRSAINKRNKELQHVSKDLSLSENFLSEQLSTIDFYILIKSIISHNRKSLLKSVYAQQKKLSSLTKDCSLPIFTANEAITKVTQYELSQDESD